MGARVMARGRAEDKGQGKSKGVDSGLGFALDSSILSRDKTTITILLRLRGV